MWLTAHTLLSLHAINIIQPCMHLTAVIGEQGKYHLCSAGISGTAQVCLVVVVRMIMPLPNLLSSSCDKPEGITCECIPAGWAVLGPGPGLSQSMAVAASASLAGLPAALSDVLPLNTFTQLQIHMSLAPLLLTS